MFFNKKKLLMMTIFIYLYDRSFESNRSFITEHVKIVEIPGFFK